ncbi:MAG: hypothetical protein MUO40_09455, partial [Anaerolineaceae bacterium]|nr:hypothetical protein [Anaerolineaceae bacterium]
DLYSPSRIPFSIDFSNKSGKRLHHQEIPVATSNVELIFPLQLRSADQKFYILLKSILNTIEPIYPTDAIQLLGLKAESKTDKRQDEFEPVIRSFHCNLPAIQW